MQLTATRCNCNCNTLQHTATHYHYLSTTAANTPAHSLPLCVMGCRRWFRQMWSLRKVSTPQPPHLFHSKSWFLALFCCVEISRLLRFSLSLSFSHIYIYIIDTYINDSRPYMNESWSVSLSLSLCRSSSRCLALCGVTVRCGVLQYVAVCCSRGNKLEIPRLLTVLLSVRCSVLQCAAVCCSVLQCVAVYCNVMWQ